MLVSVLYLADVEIHLVGQHQLFLMFVYKLDSESVTDCKLMMLYVAAIQTSLTVASAH